MRGGIAFKIYREKTIEQINAKIKLLGVNYKPERFLNERLILMVVVFIFLLVGSSYGYFLAPLGAGLVYFFYQYLVLDYPIKKRAKRLEKEALFFFEVFTLSLESGRNLRQALYLTIENVEGELSQEFRKMIEEVNMGKSLDEAMEAIRKRIPSEVINNTILNMIQANSFGSNIVVSMNNQIDFLREKQRLDVKAEIQKLPTKISVISVIFFVPIMLLIILAPILINYIMK